MKSPSVRVPVRIKVRTTSTGSVTSDAPLSTRKSNGIMPVKEESTVCGDADASKLPVGVLVGFAGAWFQKEGTE
jgi:hypothetical protein